MFPQNYYFHTGARKLPVCQVILSGGIAFIAFVVETRRGKIQGGLPEIVDVNSCQLSKMSQGRCFHTAFVYPELWLCRIYYAESCGSTLLVYFLVLGSWGASIFVCRWCLWLRCFTHLWHPGLAAVVTVFGRIQKAVFWLIRCECYVPIQERLVLLPELTALRSHVGLCLFSWCQSVPPGTAPLHSVFPSFPERRKQALQALNNPLNISVWWLEIINELLNFISCLYNVRCYLAFELQMNLLNHTFFFSHDVINLVFL